MTPGSGWARPPRCSASPSRRSAAGRTRAACAWTAPTAASASCRSPRSPGSSPSAARQSTDRPIVAQSARNRFPGIVTRIEKDRVAAVVEVIAGPHRLVSLMTAEAVDELGLRGRRRGRLRGQGDQRDRRDPVVQGEPLVIRPPSLPVAIAAAARSPAAAARPRRRRRRAPRRRRVGRAGRRRPSCTSTPPPRSRRCSTRSKTAYETAQPGRHPRRSRPTRRPRSRRRSSRAPRPTSSCPPTRRTRRSSSTAGSRRVRSRRSPATC